MLSRRSLLVASLSTVCAAPDGFQNFISGMRAEARQAGISAATLDRAFAGVQVNQKVLEHYRHQPEFTMTWAQYRALLITDQRIANGRAAFQQNRALLGRVQGPVRRRSRRDHRHLGPGVQLRRRHGRLPCDRGPGDARLGRPPRQLLPRRTDGRAAHPRPWRRGAGAHARLLCRRDGPAAVHAVVLPALRGGLRGPWQARHLDQQARRAGLDRQLPRAVRLAQRRAVGPGGDPGREPRQHRDRARQPPAGRRMGAARRAPG